MNLVAIFASENVGRLSETIERQGFSLNDLSHSTIAESATAKHDRHQIKYVNFQLRVYMTQRPICLPVFEQFSSI